MDIENNVEISGLPPMITPGSSSQNAASFPRPILLNDSKRKFKGTQRPGSNLQKSITSGQFDDVVSSDLVVVKKSRDITIPQKFIDTYVKELTLAIESRTSSEISTLQEIISDGSRQLDTVIRDGIAAIAQRDNKIVEFEKFAFGLVNNIQQLAIENSKLSIENNNLHVSLQDANPTIERLRAQLAAESEVINRIARGIGIDEKFNTVQELLTEMYVRLQKRLDECTASANRVRAIDIRLKAAADNTHIETTNADDAFSVIGRIEAKFISNEREMKEADKRSNNLFESLKKCQENVQMSDDVNRRERDEHLNAISAKDVIIADLNSALERSTLKISEMMKRNDILSDDVDNMLQGEQERNNELTSKVNHLTAKLSVKSSEVLECERQVRELQEKLASVERSRDENARLSLENANLSRDLQIAMKQQDESRNELIDTTRRLEVAMEQAARAERSMEILANAQPLASQAFEAELSLEAPSANSILHFSDDEITPSAAVFTRVRAESMSLTFAGIGVDEFIDESLVSIDVDNLRTVNTNIDFPAMIFNDAKVVTIEDVGTTRYAQLRDIHPSGAVYLPDTKQLLLGGAIVPGTFQRIPISVNFNLNGISIDGKTRSYNETYRCSICNRQLKHLELARQHMSIHARASVVNV